MSSSKAALEKNFLSGINDCGRDYMKTDNYWVHVKGTSQVEKELIEELRSYAQKIEFNPSRLEEVEDRLSEINGLKRKYGGDIALVLDHREKVSNELDILSCFQENMEKVQKDIKFHQAVLSKLSVILAEKREKTASIFK